MNRVLITAGGSGIGRAMAVGFDAAGFEVWVTDVDARALADLPGHWNARACDATDEAAMAAVVAEVSLELVCAAVNLRVEPPTHDWKVWIVIGVHATHDGFILQRAFALLT